MFLKVLLVAGIGLAGTGVALADDDDWAGLYQAVDIVDGSVDTLSIAPNDDGTYEIRMSSTGFGMCDEGKSAGALHGTGHVEDGHLVRKDVTFRCLESGETGELKSTRYVPHEELDILTIEGPGGRVTRFHKID